MVGGNQVKIRGSLEETPPFRLKRIHACLESNKLNGSVWEAQDEWCSVENDWIHLTILPSSYYKVHVIFVILAEDRTH